MNAGSAAEALTLSTDETKKRIISAVMDIIRVDIPSITEGAISKALFAGCAIVSTVSNVLRVPTKEDVAARVQETNSRKKPRLNGVGERQSIAKILNSDERLEKGVEYDQAKSAELKAKEGKETVKLERRRQEFPLLLKCKELELTQVVPQSKAGHQYSLLKSELTALCSKLGLEEDCKKVSKKKFTNLNRTELGDYLLTKLNRNGNVNPQVSVEILVATEPSIAVVEEAVDSELFASWESINEYLHGQYGFGTAILESKPSRADVIGLRKFYINGSEDDKLLIDSAWYKHPQFKFAS